MISMLVMMFNMTIYYDKHAGHDISFNDKLYRVIRDMDVVIVD